MEILRAERPYTVTAATRSAKFTSADLKLMPDDAKRYEVIGGELYVSRQPSAEHQYTCTCLARYFSISVNGMCRMIEAWYSSHPV